MFRFETMKVHVCVISLLEPLLVLIEYVPYGDLGLPEKEPWIE